MENEHRLRFPDLLPHYLKFSERLKSTIKNSDKSNTKLIEIGCGAGDVTAAFLDLGYDAYGTDIEFKDGPKIKDLVLNGRVLKIGQRDLSRKTLSVKRELYRIPFPDETFDISFSESTIEHVENLDDFVSEAARVTKSNGLSIHYFPSKFALIEPHIGIPFGGILKSKLYYRIMINFGFSFKRYQNSRGPQDCIDFINSATFYHNRSFYIRLFQKNNFELIYDGPEGIIEAKAEAGNKLAKFIRKYKFLILLFKYFRSNVYIFRKKQ